MKLVLGILGIAVGFIALSLVLKPPKGLDPKPQDTAYEKYQKNQQLEANASKSKSIAQTAALAFNPNRKGVQTVVMNIKDRGAITLELYPAEAPKTVEQFLGLVKSGYYTGILFHRIVPNFVVQAGDPLTKNIKTSDLVGKSDKDIADLGLGKNGSGKTVEFESNKLPHQEGTLSLALSAPKSDTGDSQFFIDLGDSDNNKALTGDYCVFGKVIQGMDVVKKISLGDRIDSITVQPASK